MKQFNIAEAKAQLSELVKRALAGEEIVIARDNKPLVKLVNIATAVEKKRVAGSARGRVRMAADFDARLPDFTPYQ